MPPAIAECTGGSAMAAWAIGGKVSKAWFFFLSGNSKRSKIK